MPHIPPGATAAPILKTAEPAVSSYTHNVYVVPFTGSPKSFWASWSSPLLHFQENLCLVYGSWFLVLEPTRFPCR